MLWLFQVFALTAGLYGCQVWATSSLTYDSSKITPTLCPSSWLPEKTPGCQERYWYSPSEISWLGWNAVEAVETRLKIFQPHFNRSRLKSTVSTALQPQVFIEASAELTIFNWCVISYFKHSDAIKGHVKMFSLRPLSSCLRPEAQEQGLLEIWNLSCQPECHLLQT